MTKPNEKFKKHKTIKTPGGRSVRSVLSKKTGKHICSICGEMLFGMPHGLRPVEVQRLSKTERRPENPLASMVCPRCRRDIYLSTVMLKYGIITDSDIDLRHKKYINMIQGKVE